MEKNRCKLIVSCQPQQFSIAYRTCADNTTRSGVRRSITDPVRRGRRPASIPVKILTRSFISSRTLFSKKPDVSHVGSARRLSLPELEFDLSTLSSGGLGTWGDPSRGGLSSLSGDFGSGVGGGRSTGDGSGLRDRLWRTSTDLCCGGGRSLLGSGGTRPLGFLGVGTVPAGRTGRGIRLLLGPFFASVSVSLRKFVESLSGVRSFTTSPPKRTRRDADHAGDDASELSLSTWKKDGNFSKKSFRKTAGYLQSSAHRGHQGSCP